MEKDNFSFLYVQVFSTAIGFATDPLMFWTQPKTPTHSSGSVKIQAVALFAASTHVEPSCLGRLYK